MGQPTCLEKMTLVRGLSCLVRKGQWASKASTDLLSIRSDNRNHKDPLELNKLGSFKAPFGPPKALGGPS